MKFAGTVGFYIKDKEIKPGVFKDSIIEYPYTGDIRYANKYFQADGNQNDAFKVNNRISIVSDLFAQKNFLSIRYVKWNNQKIEAKSVTIESPVRISIELGGEYIGEN